MCIRDRANNIVTIGWAADSGATINIGACDSPIIIESTPPASKSPAIIKTWIPSLFGNTTFKPEIRSHIQSTIILPTLPTKDVIMDPLASPRYLKSNVAVPRRNIDAKPYKNPVDLPFADVRRPESIIMPIAIMPIINACCMDKTSPSKIKASITPTPNQADVTATTMETVPVSRPR